MKIPYQSKPLITLARTAASAAGTLGGSVGLKQNTAAAIAADLAPVVDPPAGEATAGEGVLAQCAEAQARIARARREYNAAYAAAKAYCGDCVDSLKGVFGRRWNARWNAAGFTTGSIAVANTNPLPVLLKLAAFFRDQPQHETPARGVTAARTEELLAALEAAARERRTERAHEGQTRQERDRALKTLHDRMSGLQQELSHLLEDDDPRWLQFGFTRPVNRRLPEPVAEVRLSSLAPGTVIAEWKLSAGAKKYRVRWRAEADDAEWMDVGLFTDPLALLRELPSGESIRVAISARHRSLETQPTDAVVVVT